MSSSIQNDWEFDLGEKVQLGLVEAVVVGQATFTFEPDSYQLLFTDEHGVPTKRWFDENLFSKIRKH
jgi:hypothetical protein